MSQTCCRRLLASVVLAAVSLSGAWAQPYRLVVESHAVHSGVVGETDLTGYTTYRFYIETSSATDRVASIYGNSTDPLLLSSSAGLFFNSQYANGSTGDGLDPSMVAAFPETEFDSYVTIGRTANAGFSADPIAISEDPAQQWSSAFLFFGANAGQNIAINTTTGGSWSLPASAPEAVAGADLRVLVMQITAPGDLSGTLNAAIHVGGNPANTVHIAEAFNTAAALPAGCTDPAACNYAAFSGPGYCLQIENLGPPTGAGTSGLTGYSTYRVYALCENQNDFVSSVIGDASFPTRILTSGTFFQSPYGGLTNANQNPFLISFIPSLGFDSYISIGMTAPATGSQNPINVLPASPAWGASFEAGNDLVIDDAIGGGWYALTGDANGVAGDDYRVLLGQFTTNGSLSGQMYIQFFENGNPASYFRKTVYLNEACYGPEITTTCSYPAAGLDCAGNCAADADGDGVCDADEVAGCTDSSACNFNAAATDDDGSCTFAGAGLDCTGSCLADIDGDGVCDGDEVTGCTFASACNFNAAATDDDGSCTYAAAGLTCAGACVADTDGDGICNGDEIAGCTASAACNFNAAATDNDGSCAFAAAGYDCAGDCLADGDGDGVCDPFEVAGCTNLSACNYLPTATDDNGSCTFPAAGYNCLGGCAADADGDGICDAFEVPGCTDTAALNFDPTATDNDGSCIDGACNDSEACNYAPVTGSPCVNVEVVAQHTSGELAGMTTYRVYAVTANANDFVSAVSGDNSFPTQVNSTSGFYQHMFGQAVASDLNTNLIAFFPNLAYDSWVTIGLTGPAAPGQIGISTQDSPANNWVDVFEAGGDINISDPIGGAWYILTGASNGIAGDDHKVLLGQFTTAGTLSGQMYVQVLLNGNPATPVRTTVHLDAPCAAYDESACTYPGTYTDCSGACNNDSDGDGLCDEQEVAGCTDADACNYDATATDDDGSCTFAASGYDCAGACLSDADGDGICNEFEIAGCADADACNYDTAATDDDGSCTYAASGYDCAGACLNDADGDGLCDEFEVAGCTDADACNYDAAATDDDGSCTFAASGYNCAGACVNDTDADGVCNEFEIAGCQDADACNYDATATDGASCFFALAGYDCAGACLNDTDGDSICNEFEVAGCTVASACNFNAAATDNDGSCAFAAAGYDCAGDCLADGDGDGVCDPFEVAGCTNLSACNYLPTATDDNGSCTFPAAGYNCLGGCAADADGDGICDAFEVPGCTDTAALNFDPTATDNDGSCIDGACNDSEACNYAPVTGSPCVNVEVVAQHTSGELAGMTTYRVYAVTANANDFVSAVSGDNSFPTQVNSTSGFYQHMFGQAVASDLNTNLIAFFPNLAYDSWVTIGLTGPAAPGQIGISTQDSPANNWVDVFEAGGDINISDPIGGAWYILTGASNGIAGDDHKVLLGQFTTAGTLSGQMYVQVLLNGNPATPVRTTVHLDAPCAAYDESACTYPGTYTDCSGACNNDSDGDGLCDEQEVAGCTDADACNYDATATDDDGSCTFAASGYDCAGACLSDADGDGICNEFEIAGCADADACNYDTAATDDDGSCTYAASGYDCAGACLNDADGDGLCDEFEVAGCTDADACNYDATATDEDGTCTFAASGYDCAGACLIDTDADGVCNEFEIAGCQDADACNYDATATDDDGSCTYAASGYDCAGACLIDTDADGICNEFEIAGCQDATACNYDATATDEDGSCTYAASGYDCAGACLTDTDGDGICNAFEVAGCTDPTACNYNAAATDENGSCTYAATYYDCSGACLTDSDGDGICDVFEVCDLPSACGPGTYWDATNQLCLPIVDDCPYDTNDDGQVQLQDLLNFLMWFGYVCP